MAFFPVEMGDKTEIAIGTPAARFRDIAVVPLGLIRGLAAASFAVLEIIALVMR